MRHLSYSLSFLCLTLVVLAGLPAWADDVTGNVIKINTASKSINIVAPSLEVRARPTEYLITLKPGTMFWKSSPNEINLQQAEGEGIGIRFEDISLGDRLLVRGQRSKNKISALTILDAGSSYLVLHGHPSAQAGN